MTKTLTAALAISAPILLIATPSFADDPGVEVREAEVTSGFFWEGEIEIGYESVFSSNPVAPNPSNRGSAAYAIGEMAGRYTFSETISMFAGVTFEEVEDPLGNTGYGFYIDSLGLEFTTGNATFQLGKVAPVFGGAWDYAAGFYGGALAEDYELAEMIGGLADVELGDGSVLSMGVFFADTTVLSESAGFNRTRNTKAAGGVGNTKKLNNASIQWSKEVSDTYFHLGARMLSAGMGDTADEKGFVAGIGHSFTPSGVPLDLFAEVASFDSYGGVAGEGATYATLNAAYAIGDLTLSGTYARRDISGLPTSAGVTDVYSIAAEYEFKNGILLGAGLALVDEEGVAEDKLLGLNIIIPLGG